MHLLLYVCLLVQPLSGYLGSAYSGYAVKFFGLTLPAWAPKDLAIKDAMSFVHLGNGWLLVMLFVLHLAASGKHSLIDRDGSFRRIWPWPARGPGRSGQRLGPLAAPGCLEQLHRRRKIALARDVERALAAVVLEIRPCAGVEQRLDRIAVAVAGGPHQRGELVGVDRVRIDARR